MAVNTINENKKKTDKKNKQSKIQTSFVLFTINLNKKERIKKE